MVAIVNKKIAQHNKRTDCQQKRCNLVLLPYDLTTLNGRLLIKILKHTHRNVSHTNRISLSCDTQSTTKFYYQQVIEVNTYIYSLIHYNYSKHKTTIFISSYILTRRPLQVFIANLRKKVKRIFLDPIRGKKIDAYNDIVSERKLFIVRAAQKYCEKLRYLKFSVAST